MLIELRSTLHQNYWAVLASKERKFYGRRSALSNPTVAQLHEHLQKARIDPMWSEAKKM